MSDIIQRITKTYVTTRSYDNEFPPEFITSRSQRFIEVLNVRAIYKDYIVGDLELHASFIDRDHDLNYFCCMANNPSHYVKKYEYLTERKDFHFWFTNTKGETIEPDSFTIELKLTY